MLEPALSSRIEPRAIPLRFVLQTRRGRLGKIQAETNQICPTFRKSIKMTNLFRIKAFSVVKEGEPEVESDAECDNQTTVGRAWAHHTTVPHTMDPSHTRKVPMLTMGSWVPGPSHKNKAPLISSWSPRILDFASSNYQPRVLQSYSCILQGKIVFMSPAMFFTDMRKA